MTAQPAPYRRRAFLRHDGGATAVEFALVAAPFIALLLGIIQTFLVFFAGQQLQSIVTQTSRLILTGQAQDQGLTQATFAQALCSHVAVLFTCSNIMIDVEAYTSGQVTNVWQYNPGSPGQIVVVRAMYQWPVFLGPLGFNLSNLANGDRLLMATAAFKNEPYQ